MTELLESDVGTFSLRVLCRPWLGELRWLEVEDAHRLLVGLQWQVPDLLSSCVG